MSPKIKVLSLTLATVFSVYSACWAGTCDSTSCVGSSPWTVASPSYADVNHCINTCAAKNDTILIPAGNASWDNQLVIGKALKIIGKGSGSTVITSTYKAPTSNTTDSRTCLIYYSANPDPAPASIDFRISGFTFDLGDSSGAVFLRNDSVTPIRNLRIDNNIFLNTVGYRTIYSWGQIWGLIDNNTFNTVESATGIYGSNKTSWGLTFRFGTNDNMYVEDNIFKNLRSTPHSGGGGGRYAARYNTYVNDQNGLYPWFDSHGNQGVGGNYSGMGLEIYGNKLTHSYPTAGVSMVDQRGGKGIVFSNLVLSTPTVSAQAREEYSDALNPPAFGPDGQPQHVSDSYYWNNRKNGSTLIPFKITQDTVDRSMTPNDPPVLVENREFWQQATTGFDGTTGVGCGTLASRPATCTPGVAFWATDQSCNTVDEANVGANPKTPLSGTLYKCTALNTWTAYFAPYTYPHPLRSESTGISPPTRLRLQD
jgi:hypothetical protein